MRKTFLRFGLCALLAAACDTSPTLRFAGAGPTGPGGGNTQNALIVQPTQIEIGVGASFQLTTNAPGTPLNWSTSNSGIAGVSATGLVTGFSAGVATVTATSTSDPTQTASATVIVRAR